MPRDRSPLSADSLMANAQPACRVLRFLRKLRLLRIRSGPRAATQDKLPVVGEVTS